ncbi:MAG: hypothetical protein PHI64_13730 [Zoogloea sp.]|uniref:hypothetical protein n=1 Tax=Zoogloea sp. TaxID=49181 RepID=UPI0026113734|nr:hypothetical protein [Zoogloea sp.]MDD2990012.1 hypothetical protein [Zoogloea sp.]
MTEESGNTLMVRLLPKATAAFLRGLILSAGFTHQQTGAYHTLGKSPQNCRILTLYDNSVKFGTFDAATNGRKTQRLISLMTKKGDAP